MYDRVEVYCMYLQICKDKNFDMVWVFNKKSSMVVSSFSSYGWFNEGLKLLCLNKSVYKSLIGCIRYINKGLVSGFVTILVVEGRGFNLYKSGRYLILKGRFSHSILFLIEDTLFVRIQNKRLFLYSTDRLVLSKFVQLIRYYYKPDIYKGKGILYYNENLVLKEGKER